MSASVNVNNAMLTWAIARVGFEFSTFAEKYPLVQMWLDGAQQPTVKQLETFSKKVYLPFGYLFLPQPPEGEITYSILSY